MPWKRVTCSSFPWNKAGDFRTPTLCPNMDKKHRSCARGKLHGLRYIHIRKFLNSKKSQLLNENGNANENGIC